jgi:LmbE family N-acetylglucosaminyl deacetylase
MKKQKPNLILVAHPDDETLFFGGLIMSRPRERWQVICVTDGNADGQGARRAQQFAEAMTALKVKEYAMLGFPDLFEQRLDLTPLIAKIKSLAQEKKWPTPRQVFTHSIIGDYGHPHHQDVSFATHKIFNSAKIPVWSVAYNCWPDKVIKLSPSIFRRKGSILSEIYLSETERFAQILPLHPFEAFARLNFKEVEAIYGHLSHRTVLVPGDLKKYLWFEPYLKALKEIQSQRPF